MPFAYSDPPAARPVFLPGAGPDLGALLRADAALRPAGDPTVALVDLPGSFPVVCFAHVRAPESARSAGGLLEAFQNLVVR